MTLTPSDVELVRRRVARVWRRLRGALPAHELDDVTADVLLVLVQARNVSNLEAYAHAVTLSVLRSRRRAHDRTRSIELHLVGRGVPDHQWGGARNGAGRRRNAGQSCIRNSS